jgi:hypothetical protein
MDYAVAGDEHDLLALDPGMDDGNLSVNCLNFVIHSFQGKAHSTDHCQFCIHEISLALNLKTIFS